MERVPGECATGGLVDAVVSFRVEGLSGFHLVIEEGGFVAGGAAEAPVERAISSTQQNSDSLAGANCATKESSRAWKRGWHSLVRTMVLAVSPWSRALAAERALPAGVTGPWERAPLRRDASICW